jgi:hypothetical protein
VFGEAVELYAAAEMQLPNACWRPSSDSFWTAN